MSALISWAPMLHRPQCVKMQPATAAVLRVCPILWTTDHPESMSIGASELNMMPQMMTNMGTLQDSEESLHYSVDDNHHDNHVIFCCTNGVHWECDLPSNSPHWYIVMKGTHIGVFNDWYFNFIFMFLPSCWFFTQERGRWCYHGDSGSLAPSKVWDLQWGNHIFPWCGPVRRNSYFTRILTTHSLSCNAYMILFSLPPFIGSYLTYFEQQNISIFNIYVHHLSFSLESPLSCSEHDAMSILER